MSVLARSQAEVERHRDGMGAGRGQLLSVIRTFELAIVCIDIERKHLGLMLSRYHDKF